MKRIVLAAIGAVILLAGATSAMAQQAPITTPDLSVIQQGQIYHRSDLFPTPDGPPVPLPEIQVDAPSIPTALAVMGPSDFASSPVMGLGGAMLTPRGGAEANPKAQADRQIKRVIRRLG